MYIDTHQNKGVYMKKLLSAILIFSGLVASANTVETTYLKNSVLPSKLQQMIIDAVQTKCGNATSQYGLREINTDFTVGDFNGEPYTFFTTEFDSRYYSDGMHPTYTRITVYSELRGNAAYAVGRIVSDVCEQ